MVDEPIIDLGVSLSIVLSPRPLPVVLILIAPLKQRKGMGWDEWEVRKEQAPPPLLPTFPSLPFPLVALIFPVRVRVALNHELLVDCKSHTPPLVCFFSFLINPSPHPLPKRTVGRVTLGCGVLFINPPASLKFPVSSSRPPSPTPIASTRLKKNECDGRWAWAWDWGAYKALLRPFRHILSSY